MLIRNATKVIFTGYDKVKGISYSDFALSILRKSILKEGLWPMSRQYVHLSEGTHFATLAGSRRGELVILKVDTKSAKQLGVTFYYAGNEVWLADRVPPVCCSVMEANEKEQSNYESSDR